ncbi:MULTISPECIES: aquaporin [unclassified Bradyrhizobium]|nr:MULTISPECIES: aquaporin [unclassified Bradyrhizobium]QIG98204.1 hypothetical protein G6P99_42455 [Bradyrhizobium sp. 6(2017)]
MNPAVTVGVLAAGAIQPLEAMGYIVFQLIGGSRVSLAARCNAI